MLSIVESVKRQSVNLDVRHAYEHACDFAQLVGVSKDDGEIGAGRIFALELLAFFIPCDVGAGLGVAL